MADEAAVVTETAPAPEAEVATAVEVAPVTPPEDAAVETAPEQPTGPLDKNAVRAQIRSERAARRAEAETATAEVSAETGTPTIDAAGRKHDPTSGQFLPEEGDKVDVAPEGDATGETQEATTSAESQDDVATPPAEPEAPASRRVAVDPSHPIVQARQLPGGATRDYIDVVSEEDQVMVNALLKGSYHRRREVTDLRTDLTTERDQHAKTREELIKLQSNATATEQWKSRPEYQKAVTAFHELRAQEEQGTVPEGTSSAYWEGQKAGLKALVDTETSNRMTAVSDAESERQGQEWVRESLHQMDSLPGHVRALPDFERWHREEVTAFDGRVTGGEYNHLQGSKAYHAEFAKLMASRLMREPAVSQSYADQKKAKPKRAPEVRVDTAEERKRKDDLIASKAIEGYKREAADTRAKTPPNPLTTIGEAPALGVSPVAEIDTSQMNAHQLKTHLKMESREAARARFGR